MQFLVSVADAIIPQNHVLKGIQSFAESNLF